MNKENGLKVQSWSDITAIAALLAMFMACVAWGLKLEGELNSVRDDSNINRLEIRNMERDLVLHERIGAHPRADVRIKNLEKEAENHNHR